MVRSVRALVKPEILVWARERAGYDQETAAKKVQIKLDRFAQWEAGEEQPTVNQLRNLARVYKRPLSVFYLQESPTDFQVLKDFRRLPGTGLRSYSPELIGEMRFAQQRRELALELLNDLEETPRQFRLSTTLGSDPEDVAALVRESLGVSYQSQSRWRNDRVAFLAWRDFVEALGVLVFQMDKVSETEVSGFAISAESLPVIAINRKKTPETRRTFSLFHELTHLMLRTSGVSELDVEANRPPEEQRVEVFCNRVAAAVLIPRDNFVGEEVVQSHGAHSDWDDVEIAELSKVYSVSREAIVRRLLTFGKTSDRFYRTKRAQYKAEREARQARKATEMEGQEFRRNPPRDAVSNFGKPFVRLVLNNFHNERITLREVSLYLGLRVRHVPKIEQYVGLG